MADGHDTTADHGDRAPAQAGPGGAPPESQLPPQVQILADRAYAAATGHGPELNHQDQATLASWQQFPNDEHLRDLEQKDFMSMYGGTDLDPGQKAELYSTKQFPDDPHYRDLMAREILAGYGGAKLSDQESSDLGAKRQFPNDDHYRELACKENMYAYGGPPLTKAEATALFDKRITDRAAAAIREQNTYGVPIPSPYPQKS